MLLHAIPFEKIWKELHKKSGSGSGLISFIHFIEQRLGARFLYDTRRVPFGMPELIDLFELAEEFKKNSIITDYRHGGWFCDEPRLKAWRVHCADTAHNIAGGLATSDDRAALTAALAEGVERYVWLEKTDHFTDPVRATVDEIVRKGAAVAPGCFVGFSEDQRKTNASLTLHKDAKYLFVRGTSHTQKREIWIPAQVVSGSYGAKNRKTKSEPLIIAPITSGLATGPTREFALLGGALELIERDAFMITWLNQLTPPSVDLSTLAKESESLEKLLRQCERYRLVAKVALLPTDAPAYAVVGIVTDKSAEGPAVTIGLKAHRDLARAAEGALLEALRMRHNVRHRRQHRVSLGEKKKEELNHFERTDYWATMQHPEKLDFLSSGTSTRPHDVWEHDTEEEHLARIIAWCREKNYELASVDLGISRANVSPWHIQMVVIPELQPIHQNEKLPYVGGKRLKSIPEQFGYTPRRTPFLEEPHPFA